MRYLYLFLVLALAAGCGDSATDTASETTVNADGTVATHEEGNNGASTASNQKKKPSNNWQKLEMIAFKDNKGRVIAEAPYPPDWNIKTMIKQGEPGITGPNGVKIMDQPFKSYIYTNDPYYQQLYTQSGQQVIPWPGAEQLVKQHFVPELRNQGWTFKRWYEVPEVAKVDKWYNDQLYKAVPMKMQVVAIGSEWENANGEPAFMITHAQVSNTDLLQTWSYYSSVLKADKGHFDKAKKQYIFSMANTRYALEPIMEYNQEEARKAGQSWAAHNQRMAQNQANFEKQQRDFVNRSNSINESVMSNWEQNNASSDRQHQKTIDGIREEDNSYSSSGQQYKTSIHYNNYWISSDGQYISTNQNDYNPNQDDNLNNQNWQKLQKND